MEYIIDMYFHMICETKRQTFFLTRSITMLPKHWPYCYPPFAGFYIWNFPFHQRAFV